MHGMSYDMVLWALVRYDLLSNVMGLNLMLADAF